MMSGETSLMSGEQYAILGYIVSFVLLGGYALNLWLMSRRLHRRERSGRGQPSGGSSS